MDKSKRNPPDWLTELPLDDLPELLQGAAQELKTIAEASAAPIRDELDLVSRSELQRLETMLQRMEERISQIENQLDQLESE